MSDVAARYCIVPGCARSSVSHLWDPETCPDPCPDGVVSDMASSPDYGLPVEVGSRWKRNPPGREVVEVQRVWDYSALGDFAVPTVRAHPTTGGRPLVAPVGWFTERYTRVTPPDVGAP